MDINKVFLIGVIKENKFSANVKNIIRPTAQIACYDEENKIWIDNIYIIFSSNSDARRFRAVNIGDVIMVSGDVQYVNQVGYAVFLDKYTILYTDKFKNAYYNRALLVDSCLCQNSIILKVNVLTFNEESSIATVTYTSDTDIRGNYNSDYILPVKVLNNNKVEVNKTYALIGRFSEDYIFANLYDFYS